MPTIVDRDEKLVKVCLRLWKDDMDTIREMANSGSSAGINGVIRRIIHTYVMHVKDRERKNLDVLVDLAAED